MFPGVVRAIGIVNAFFQDAQHPALLKLPPDVQELVLVVIIYLSPCFRDDLARVRALFSCPRENTVVGTIRARFPRVKVETLVEWDEKLGFTVFKVGSLEIRKCSYYPISAQISANNYKNDK